MGVTTAAGSSRRARTLAPPGSWLDRSTATPAVGIERDQPAGERRAGSSPVRGATGRMRRLGHCRMGSRACRRSTGCRPHRPGPGPVLLPARRPPGHGTGAPTPRKIKAERHDRRHQPRPRHADGLVRGPREKSNWSMPRSPAEPGLREGSMHRDDHHQGRRGNAGNGAADGRARSIQPATKATHRAGRNSQRPCSAIDRGRPGQP